MSDGSPVTFTIYAVYRTLSMSNTTSNGVANPREQVTSKATRNRNAASKKLISRKSSKIKGFRFHGGIAQLGERLNGIQEVSGSIPLISTKNGRICEVFRESCHFFIPFRSYPFRSIINVLLTRIR